MSLLEPIVIAALRTTAGPFESARTLPSAVMRDPAIYAIECTNIFATAPRDIEPPFSDQIATLPDVDRYRLGDLTLARRLDYDVAANWKILCENYSECYHCPNVHPQLTRVSDLLVGSFHEATTWNGGPMGLRAGCTTLAAEGIAINGARKGLTAEDARLVRYFLVYPAFMLGLAPDYVTVHRIEPRGVDQTRVHCEIYTEPSHPCAIDAIAAFWDLTNRQDWELCERVQAGVTSTLYRPGPFHSSERCVHAFDRWYARHLLTEDSQ
jgi:glycine betaine catabolism A